MTKPRKLPPRQARFVQEYLKDLNATQAAIRAGYSAKTADVCGPRMLGFAGVASAIQVAQEKLAAKNELTVERIVEELRRIGVSDLRALFDEAGNLRPINTLPDHVAAAIASVEVVSRPVAGGDKGDIEYVHKVRAWDKPRALELLGKYLGILVDRQKHEVSGTIGLVALTPEQAARLDDDDLAAICRVAAKARGEVAP